MGNPWKDISLSDYENHMCLDSVKQLQVLNEAMKEQFDMFPVDNAMVLGVAGGNGLEHIDPAKYVKVYGVDINAGYLEETKNRYKELEGILECICLDLINEPEKLPHSDLLIANLLIEYIGYEAFQKVVKKINPKYVSAVIHSTDLRSIHPDVTCFTQQHLQRTYKTHLEHHRGDQTKNPCPINRLVVVWSWTHVCG